VDAKFCADHTSRKGGTMPAKFKKAETNKSNPIGDAIEKSAKDAEEAEKVKKVSAKKSAAKKKAAPKKAAKKKAAKKAKKAAKKKPADRKAAAKKAAKTRAKLMDSGKVLESVSWPDIMEKFQKAKKKSDSVEMGSPGSAQVTRVRLAKKYPKIHFRTEGTFIHFSKVKFK